MIAGHGVARMKGTHSERCTWLTQTNGDAAGHWAHSCDEESVPAQSFKATAKGKGKLANSSAGDIWLHCVALILLTSTIAIGVWQLVAGAKVRSPLLISVLWAVYTNIAPFLLVISLLKPLLHASRKLSCSPFKKGSLSCCQHASALRPGECCTFCIGAIPYLPAASCTYMCLQETTRHMLC